MMHGQTKIKFECTAFITISVESGTHGFLTEDTFCHIKFCLYGT